MKILRDWKRIMQSGLCKGVETLNDYTLKVTIGEIQALKTVKETPMAVPSERDVSALHRLMFEEVHPWAGDFRKQGQVVIVAGNLSCEPPRISMELAMLEHQTATLLGSASTEQQKMTAIAFHHARFELIHPFLDGNGRVGRILLESQLYAIFGVKQRAVFSRAHYIQALASAQKGDLKGLANLLLEREGLKTIQTWAIESPYRMAPFLVYQNEALRTLEQELSRSVHAPVLTL